MEVPNIQDLKKEDIIGVWENMSIISNSSPDAFIPKMGERTRYTFLKNNKYRFESGRKFQEGEWCLNKKLIKNNKLEFIIVLDEKLEHIITSIKRDELEKELRLLGKRSIQYSKQYIENIPIPKIDLLNNNQKKIHDTIAKLVDNLLKHNKELQKTKLDTQRKQIQRAIDHSEKKIDELVYELYGLSKKEIEIIEE